MNSLKPGNLTHGKYIDPLTDFAFKKIFGSDANNDVLIDFLNAVFRGRKLIIDLQIDKTNIPVISRKNVPLSSTCIALGKKEKNLL